MGIMFVTFQNDDFFLGGGGGGGGGGREGTNHLAQDDIWAIL